MVGDCPHFASSRIPSVSICGKMGTVPLSETVLKLLLETGTVSVRLADSTHPTIDLGIHAAHAVESLKAVFELL